MIHLVLKNTTVSVFQGKKLSDSESGDGYVTDEEEGAGQEKQKKNNKRDSATKRHKLSRELSDLVTYCRSTRFDDFAASQQSREHRFLLKGVRQEIVQSIWFSIVTFPWCCAYGRASHQV